MSSACGLSFIIRRYFITLYGVSIVTDNNELSAARVQDAADTGNLFTTEIDAGVSELC